MGASLGETAIADTPVAAQLGGSWLHVVDHALLETMQELHREQSCQGSSLPMSSQSKTSAIEFVRDVCERHEMARHRSDGNCRVWVLRRSLLLLLIPCRRLRQRRGRIVAGGRGERSTVSRAWLRRHCALGDCLRRCEPSTEGFSRRGGEFWRHDHGTAVRTGLRRRESASQQASRLDLFSCRESAFAGIVNRSDFGRRRCRAGAPTHRAHWELRAGFPACERAGPSQKLSRTTLWRSPASVDAAVRVNRHLGFITFFRIYKLDDDDRLPDGVVKRGVSSVIARYGVGGQLRF